MQGSLAELFLTIIIEASVLAFAVPARIKRSKLAALSVIANLVTQPIFSVSMKAILARQDYLWWRFFVVGEVAVVVAESLLYFLLLRGDKIRLSTCFLWSLAANAASGGFGLLWPFYFS